MEQDILSAALEQGLWAVLFVTLYLYQLRESRRLQDEAKAREDKLTTFITEMSKQFESLAQQYEKMSDDLRDIRHVIEVKKGAR